MLVKYVSIDGIPQTFVFFQFVDIIDITVHDRYPDNLIFLSGLIYAINFDYCC
jgi:hypothetical protein